MHICCTYILYKKIMFLVDTVYKNNNVIENDIFVGDQAFMQDNIFPSLN